MKRIILIFLCYFCSLSSCDEQLSPEEIKRIFGPENKSAGVYGKVDIIIPSGLRTTPWHLSVPLSNGTVRTLNLTLTEGLLTDSATPLWFARVSKDSENMTLTRHEKNLEELGLFSFYQDYASRSSIVVYHDLKKIEGFFFGAYHFVQYDTYENELGQIVTRHVAVMMGKTLDPLPPAGKRAKREMSNSETDQFSQENPSRPVVYPEIVLFLAYPGVNKTWQEYLMRVIAQWNAVDMLYNLLRAPRVKPNLAGFIIPENDATVPWINEDMDETGLINQTHMLKRLRHYFEDTSDIFPRSHFDIMLGYYQLKPGTRTDGLGLSGTGGIGILNNALLNDCILTAHELGHALGAHHDETSCNNDPNGFGAMCGDIGPESFRKYTWSSSSRKQMQNFLNTTQSFRFDNCPRTKPDCKTSELKAPVCLQDVQKFCQKTPTSFVVSMSCEEGVLCYDGATGQITIGSAEGMICNSFEPWDTGKIPKGCYNGGCVRFDPSTPVCAD